MDSHTQLSRRTTLKAGAFAALAFPWLLDSVQIARAVPDGVGIEAGERLTRNGRVPTVGEFIKEYSKDTGLAKPYLQEVEKAAEILSKAPKTTTPFEVANYFFDVGQGRYGEDCIEYVKEWPIRANPLIVSFFDATTLRKPAGDTTAWCSAFVNWCIRQSIVGRKSDNFAGPTRDAASSSFRRWGQTTTNPSVGDIAVFKLNDDPSHGHVAFYVSEAGDNSIYILGGNQGALAHNNNGEINIKRVAKANSYWSIDSYRTAPDLRL
ncbi:CHAP domain-containing protein [Mesorhizobium sp. VK22B]|uniref:CHAP domain-containing protein n=1 Tax=Mesorhizobium captivum TaxID=3072319 RepID=A0ABU4Z7R5_9HYPH|nr:CHAP domain-containing protein [Mesorhizobium sp. VK22B]MDX8494633.1 CHAP domain-containing protein [Mesorhizobium sp. VK22B]